MILAYNFGDKLKKILNLYDIPFNMMLRAFLTALCLFFCIWACAQRFPVTVVGINDGDTFTGLNNDKLQLTFRIYGIDAPEKKQAFGTQAKNYLSSLIFGKRILVDVQSTDRYGRFVAYVYTPDGEDVSYLMLENGFAWHYVKYDHNTVYSKAEESARNKRLGLWIDLNPIAPWEYRKR